MSPAPALSWKVLLAYAAGSLMLDAFSNPQTVLPLALAPWTPPLGLSLAVLLLFGAHYAPWLIAVVFAAGLPIYGPPEAWLAALWASMLLMGGLLMLSAWLKRGLKIDARLSSQRDLFWLLIAAILAAWLDAGVHVFSRSPEAAPDVWAWLADLVNYWVGALIRLLVVTPLVLAHADLDWQTLRAWRPGREVFVQAAVIVIALAVIFGLKYTDEFKFFYLLFLPLIWVCMRFGIKGATLALAFIHVGLNVILEWRGLRSVAVVEFQMLMLGLAVTGLFLGMTVSARRAAEEQLHRREGELNQAMRLAAAGEMTQAIAHELNQPLSAVANYARAARAMLAQPERREGLLEETLDKIDRESTRAGQVVRRLREFFRGGGLRQEYVTVGELIEEGLAPARRRAERAGVSIQIERAEDLPRLYADRVQIGTVLHNLLVNAIEALTSQSPGRPKIDLAPPGGGSGFASPGPTPSSQSPGRPKIDLAPPGGGSGFASRGPSTSQSPGRPKIDLAPSGGGSDFASRGQAPSQSPWLETPSITIRVALADAATLRFCVGDNGPGIAPELRDRLFDSFVTSKPEGMGLGLAISRTLVQAHGGELVLDTPQPARFCFTLPIQGRPRV